MKINDADNDLRDTDSEFLSGKVLDMPQGVPSRAREGRVVYVPAWPDGKNYPNGYIQMADAEGKEVVIDRSHPSIIGYSSLDDISIDCCEWFEVKAWEFFDRTYCVNLLRFTIVGLARPRQDK
ncbi:hypothetical protein [Rathayibacter rathayi]|nr:hypothetical protein [Rathayibacter rathayi]MWV75838.1 hypothetical protein [Rathayibacter rathayi NCPPB 2980 = VKM Ac-1601]